jgi:hypothetical protein
MPAREHQRDDPGAVSGGSVQTSVTDGTFPSDAPGIVIHSSGSTAVHKADNFQATLH